jgi:hypothetical protein
VVQPISQSQPADTEESSWGYYADTQWDLYKLYISARSACWGNC